MKAQELKHMARLVEWKEKVRECRSSGMTVKGWCQEQGIAYKTYYYWEKAVLTEVGRQNRLEESKEESKFVKVPALAEGKAEAGEPRPGLVAKVQTKRGELEVYAGVEAAVLEVLVGVLKDAE